MARRNEPETLTVTTTLVEHDSKSGTGKKGRWVLNLFEDEHGDTYQTFDRALASEAADLLDVEGVEIEYTEEENGDFTNFVIQAVTGPDSVTAKPKSRARSNGNGSSRSNGNGRGGRGNDADRQKVINRSAGLARAIETFAVAGTDPFEEEIALFELAIRYAEFIETGEVSA